MMAGGELSKREQALKDRADRWEVAFENKCCELDDQIIRTTQRHEEYCIQRDKNIRLNADLVYFKERQGIHYRLATELVSILVQECPDSEVLTWCKKCHWYPLGGGCHKITNRLWCDRWVDHVIERKRQDEGDGGAT